MSEVLYDVAIVGFGPSGAVAAGLLGQAGLKVYVCDMTHEVYDKPRAIALDHEILRVFQQLDVLADIEPFCEPFTDSCYYGVDGQLIRRMTMVEEPYPQTFTPSVVFTQPPVEEVLRSKVRTLPNVTVETGMKLASLSQTDEQAILELTSETENKRIRAHYVIGCDGASSTVRQQVGIQLEDLDFDEPWLVVDVKANEQGLAKLPTTSMQYCEPERPSSFIMGPGNHRRWEISLNEGEDPAQAATPEGAWKLLSRWITPEDGELWRQASYRFHALVANQWRAGRVFVAGDAAHQQPPFLGQGMCQGVRDVTNLAWKINTVLTKTVTGPAAEALLDSYSKERKEHVRQLTSTIKSIGAVICERDVEKARQRDQRLLDEHGGVVRPTPRQDVLPTLSGGLIYPTPGAGSLFPQAWLQQGANKVRMDDVFGLGWRLVAHDSTQLPAYQALKAKLGFTQIALNDADCQEADQVLANWLTHNGVIAAVVRPDNYVFGTASDEQGLTDLLYALLDRMQ